MRVMPYDAKVIKRFWAYVRMCEHGQACPYCCWPWQGPTKAGYGFLSVYDKDQYARTKRGIKTLKANRLTIEIHDRLLIPKGLWALHYCNNPPCSNRMHLYIGTPKENSADMLRAGHHWSQQTPPLPPWNRHPNGYPLGRVGSSWSLENLFRKRTTKLTFADILDIRYLAATGHGINHIARVFSLSHSHASEIVSRKKWKNVP